MSAPFINYKNGIKIEVFSFALIWRWDVMCTVLQFGDFAYICIGPFLTKEIYRKFYICHPWEINSCATDGKWPRWFFGLDN